MIVGFGGSGLGISRQQTEALKHLLKEFTLDAAVHRGMTGMETMIHNIVRSIYPWIPVHIVPLINVYSSIAATPIVSHNIVYQPGTPDLVNKMIVRTVQGIVFLPHEAYDTGWGLAYEAREQCVPVFYIFPDGKLSLERNEL